jgi:hypothetical protein
MRQYMLAVQLVEGEPTPTQEQAQQVYKAVDAFNAELKSAGAWVSRAACTRPRRPRSFALRAGR